MIFGGKADLLNSLIAHLNNRFSRRPGLMVGLTALLVVAVYAAVTLPQVNVWQITTDAPAYAGALLQYENPALLPRDTLFRGGRMTAALWASSGLYLRLVQAGYHLSGARLEMGFWGAGAFSLGLYIVAAYSLLCVGMQRRWLALLVAVTTGTWFGFLGLPSGLFAGWGCVLARCLLVWWWLPGVRRERINTWRVLLAGLLVSFSVPLVSATNTLMVIIFALWGGLLLALLRRLPWWTLIVFSIGLLPVAGFVLQGTGGIKSISAAGAQVMVTAITDGYFPEFPFLFGSIYLLITGICLWKLRRPARRPRLSWMMVLIMGQVMLWVMTARTVTEYIFIGIYLIYRLRGKQWDDLDIVLTCGASLAFMGDWLRMGVYGVWLVTGWTWPVNPLFEMFRLPRLAFFALLVLTGRAIETIIDSLPGEKKRCWLAGVLALLHALALQPYDFVPRPEGLQALSGTALVLLALALTTYAIWQPHFQPLTRHFRLALILAVLSVGAGGLWLYSEGLFPVVPVPVGIITAFGAGSAALAVLTSQDNRGRLIAGMFCALLTIAATDILPRQEMRTEGGGTMMLREALALPREERNRLMAVPPVTEEMHEYEVLAAWIREHTSPDSLFHATDLKRDGFRFLAQRSQLIIKTDVTFTVISATDPADAQALYLAASEQTPATLTDFAARYQVDYVLTGANMQLSPAFYEGSRYGPELVYQGKYHWLYHVIAAE